MKTLQDLRAIAELLPPGGAVTLPREALLQVLGDDGAVQTSTKPTAAPGDLSVEELAAHFRRSPSTVRGWLEAGRFPGAYHLPSSGKVVAFTQGKQEGISRPIVGAWRVPPAAIAAFVAAQNGNGSHR